MPRQEVRAQITTYLKGANILHLGSVIPYPPRYTTEQQFMQSAFPGRAKGAVVYLHLAEQIEAREALGGPHGGQKRRVYTLGMMCLLRSMSTKVQELGLANDEFLDSLTGAIQAQRTASTQPNSVVWQWGEGDAMSGEDIHVTASMPMMINSQIAQIYSQLEVKVLEWLVQT